jgi:hypothetical protein
VSKAAYPYPDDEFDAPGSPDGPRGVHRAPRSAWRRWWPFLAVLVIVPVLAYGGVWLAARNGVVVPGASLVGGTSPSTSADTTPEASAAGTDAASSGAAAPAETPAAPAPVLTSPVKVVNAAGVSGLAASASTKLKAAGFTAVSVANGSKGKLTASTVYYAKADLAVTAQQVTSTLGLTAVQESATEAGGSITVVLVTKLAG